MLSRASEAVPRAVPPKNPVVTPAVHRIASAPEFVRLHEIFLTYEDDLPPELRHGAVPSPDELARRFAAPSAAFLAYAGDDVAGCVGLQHRDDATSVIRHLFVRPEFRGHGAARALVTAAIELARASAYERVVLDTHKAKLEPAFALYQALGFVEAAPHGPVDYDCPTFMELHLTARSRD
jgi:GNAT superfamily N-acetyltransferase